MKYRWKVSIVKKGRSLRMSKRDLVIVHSNTEKKSQGLDTQKLY